MEIQTNVQNKIENQEEITARRSSRSTQPFTRLSVTYSVTYLIQNFISYQNVTPKYRVFLFFKEMEIQKFEESKIVPNHERETKCLRKE